MCRLVSCRVSGCGFVFVVFYFDLSLDLLVVLPFALLRVLAWVWSLLSAVVV